MSSIGTAGQRRAHAGFTMIEMVSTLVILGVLAAVSAPILSAGLRNYLQAAEASEQDTNAKFALERIMRDLRGIRSPADLTTMTASQISYVDTTGATVSFVYSAGAGTLTRQQNGGTANTLADSVTSFTLTYLQTDGQTTAASAALVYYVTVQMTISTSGAQSTSAKYIGTVRLNNA